MLTTANAARIPLADGTVHVCVTSPPFWSLRDYGLEPTHWSEMAYSPMPGLPPVYVPAMDACLGLEPTPEAYVGHIVACFREVWRVLRKDGTAWVNLGDSYASSGQTGYQNMDKLGERLGCGGGHKVSENPCGRAPTSVGLKPKDLVGIPWRVAFALQADGWWLRSDILWVKPNCMPESVRDRPTKSHEYIFLLAKSKRYYYDAGAIRETQQSKMRRLHHLPTKEKAEGGNRNDGGRVVDDTGYRNRRTAWTIPTSPYGGAHYAAYPPGLVRIMLKASVSERGVCLMCGKPWMRVVERQFEPQESVSAEKGIRGHSGQKPMDASSGWQGVPRGSTAVNTTGWRPACTCAGKPARGTVRCGKCGGTGREMRYKTESQRLVDAERTGRDDGRVLGPGGQNYQIETGNPCPHCDNGTTEGDVWPADVDTWPVAPAIVLDPFVGSGTTAVVCQELRQLGTPVTCVGLDLNHHYLRDLARERLGLLALADWEQGIDSGDGHNLEDLPLFQNLEATPA